jgi:hypothetical protein
MSTLLDFPAGAAAAVPTQRRANLYAPIHKALRLFMGDTLARIGAVDSADQAELRSALDQLLVLLQLLRSHLEHENRFLHPALEARRPGSAMLAAEQHDEHRASIDALECEANAMAAAPAPQREPLALRLYRHLALFVAENLQHMEVEESAHNHALWAAYGDDELEALHDELLASVSPQEMSLVMQWMAPALSHAELAGMLVGMRAEMPPEAFRAVLDPVRARLSVPRWDKLARALALPQAPGLVDLR